MKENQKPGAIIIDGHVQGLANTRLLGKAGIPVIVIDKNNCVARYSKYCAKYFRCPDYHSEDFIGFLIRLNQAYDLDGWLLLPSNDHAVYNISEHKNQLSRHYRIITEDQAVINKIYNKRELLGLAGQIGVAIPATFMPKLAYPQEMALDYPVLIKGNNGLTFYKKYGCKAIYVADRTGLRSVFSDKLKDASPDEYFIQEVIPHHYKTVSVTVFAVEGEILSYWMGVKLREHPVRFGTATCCQSMCDPLLLEPSEKLVKALRYTGVCEIEYLKDPRDGISKLIEINARTWLWVGLAASCGVNYPLMIYDFVHSRGIPRISVYDTGKIWLNLYTDLFYSIKLLANGYDRLKDILKTYKSYDEACWDKKDPLPFFAYAALLPQYLKKR